MLLLLRIRHAIYGCLRRFGHNSLDGFNVHPHFWVVYICHILVPQYGPINHSIFKFWIWQFQNEEKLLFCTCGFRHLFLNRFYDSLFYFVGQVSGISSSLFPLANLLMFRLFVFSSGCSLALRQQSNQQESIGMGLSKSNTRNTITRGSDRSSKNQSNWIKWI